MHLADGFSPCFVLLNNDLSAGVPEILQDISQTVLPPLHGGWTTRRKTEHFAAYNRIAAEFAELLGIDEWQINPYFEKNRRTELPRARRRRRAGRSRGARAGENPGEIRRKKASPTSPL